MMIKTLSNSIWKQGVCIMKPLLAIAKSGLFVLILYLTIVLAILIVTEMRPVQADISTPSSVTTTADGHYLRLTDAPPPPDITRQRFAPLEIRP